MDRSMGERSRWAWLAAGTSMIAAAALSKISWPWVLAGAVPVSLYYIYMDCRLPEDGLAVWLAVRFGRFGRVLAAVSLLWSVTVMAWAARLAAQAFPMVEGLPGLGWIMLALAGWGSVKGPKACAGCCGVLCLFLAVLYGVVVGFSLPDVTAAYLRPVRGWEHSLWAAGLMLTTGSVWYLPCRKREGKPARSLAALLPAGAAALSAVTAGVLSPELTARTEVPVYALAQSVSLFGVVERIEPLLSAAMVMGLFALLSGLACGCRALADQLKPTRWSGAICCIIAAVGMVPAAGLPPQVVMVGSFLVWMAIPLAALAGKTSCRPQ